MASEKQEPTLNEELEQVIIMLQTVLSRDYSWKRKYGKTYLLVAEDAISKIIKSIK